MFMKRFILILLLGSTITLRAQTNLASYKYLIIPEKFSFLKKPNQYNLNTITQSLFEDAGYKVYYDNTELPTEIAGDRCKALALDLEEKNTMFSTNIKIVLKDCKGNLVLKSKEGKSREKEYDIAYSAAIREAFASLNELSKTPINAVDAIPAKSTIKDAEKPKPTSEANASKPAPVETKEMEKPIVAMVSAENKPTPASFLAQPTASGYVITNPTSKTTFTLLKTSAPNYYIAKGATNNGLIFKKGGKWLYEYYKDGILVSEQLSIKFENE